MSEATGTPEALVLEHLSVGHSKRPLVGDINLSVRAGEVVALIGPNGSGKTTILKTVAGLLGPLKGSVHIFGQDIHNIPMRLRAQIMATMFTDRPKTELLRAKDIVDTGRYPYTGHLGILSDTDEKAVQNAMEATGTWDLRDRDFAHMSDGQRQRTLIARALCQKPRVLLMDEPTSYLDIRAQLDMLALLRAYAQNHACAIMLSLHQIDLALKAADRLMCVKDGRVVAQGSPGAVMNADTVCALYGLEPQTYEPHFASVELPAPDGEPKVFVVAGGGTGATCFRALQRACVPFAAGVLHKHDADGILAAQLSAHVIYENDFEALSEQSLNAARASIDGCEALVCTVERFASTNARNEELLAYARSQGKPVYRSAREYLEKR